MRILVVDDDETLRLSLRLILEMSGYEVSDACDGQQAVETVAEQINSFDAVILDVNMPRLNGIDALCRIREMNPQIFCLILTAHSNIKDAVTAIKNGAFDYVEKPVEPERLLSLLKSAEQANQLVEKAVFSAPQVEFAQGRKIIGGSSEIKRVFSIIYRLSKVDTSVLIRGESGTGKELVARAIHYNSVRKKGPFVAVNCAALSEALIESELFGHERGAFTGAEKKKIGKFQYAEGGTIFLDEIGDIAAAMQVKLLRVLQEKTYTPIGSNCDHKADVRIVAATNRPLEEMIKSGIFRDDLFYRLNVLPIILPPLRDRREDIPSLVAFMIRKFNGMHNRRILRCSDQALKVLRLYDWPGNIRELENVIEHAFILETSDVINLSALPSKPIEQVAQNHKDLKESQIEKRDLISDFSLNYPELKERFEKEFIVRALKTFGGRINKTAAHTKMTKVTLLRKLEKYSIDPSEYHRASGPS